MTPPTRRLECRSTGGDAPTASPSPSSPIMRTTTIARAAASPTPMPFGESVVGMLDELVRWLVFEISPTASTVEILHGFAQRLCGAGLDLIRLNLQVRPLSPQAAAVLYVWRPVAPDALPSVNELDLRAPTLLRNVVVE